MSNARQIIIDYREKLPGKNEYEKLFATTGWHLEYRFSRDELYRSISSSWYIISAYHQKRLVGCGRVIGDGIHHAFIVDLMVEPNFQRLGIGGTILDKLVARCRQNQVRDIQLFCATGKTDFYREHGFRKRPDIAPGMEFQYSPEKKS